MQVPLERAGSLVPELAYWNPIGCEELSRNTLIVVETFGERPWGEVVQGLGRTFIMTRARGDWESQRRTIGRGRGW